MTVKFLIIKAIIITEIIMISRTITNKIIQNTMMNSAMMSPLLIIFSNRTPKNIKKKFKKVLMTQVLTFLTQLQVNNLVLAIVYKNSNPTVIGSNLLYNINLNVKLNKLE